MGFTRQPWPLTQPVLDLARRAARSPDPDLSSAGQAAVDRLEQRLCVAVVGRVSAGKSTLLNALLGAALSPTDGGECTKVVYVFRHGQWTSAVARMRDGSADRTVGFDGIRLPDDLPMPAADIENISVTLPAPFLEHLVLVDTPGMASTSEDTSARTTRLLEHAGQVDPDAILLCVNGPLKDDERAALAAFQARTRSGGSAFAVLTKADRLTDDRYATWAEASALARSMAVRHADLFAGVAPVIGLLAETAATGALREGHARALATIAREWTVEDLDLALLTDQLFFEQPGSVAKAERLELCERLGMFGIGVLVEALRAGTAPHAAALTAVARATSGVDALEHQLGMALGDRADAFRSAGVLRRIMDGAHGAGDRAVFDAAQSLLDRPELFPLQVHEMALLLSSGRARPPAGFVEQAWVVVTTGLAAAEPAEAARHAADWREWAAVTDSAGRFVATVMIRAWRLAATRERVAHG